MIGAMRLTTKWCLVCAAAWSLALSAAGCGSSRIKVEGHITRDGQPLKGHVQIVFHNLEKGAHGYHPFYHGYTRPDGSYYVPGPGGKGIPPGKYRIAIAHAAAYQGRDMLAGTFNAENSPFIRDVARSTREINLDLARPND